MNLLEMCIRDRYQATQHRDNNRQLSVADSREITGGQYIQPTHQEGEAINRYAVISDRQSVQSLSSLKEKGRDLLPEKE